MNWKRAVAAVAACTLCLAPLMGCAQEKPQDSDLGGDVLAAIQSAVNIEKAEVMDPADGTTPEIFGQFQTMLGGMELAKLGRYEFYDACCLPGVRLAVSTGEQRTFANLLITIGVA